MPVYTNPAGGGQQQPQEVQGQPGQPQQQMQQMAGVPALPATGVQQQVAGVNQQQQGLMGGPQPVQQPMGQTSLSGIAQRLATSYGLPVGRQGLVDAQGNFLQTPDQIAAESGGQVSVVDAAAKMNYVSAAIAREQQRRSQGKARATLEAGMKQVQSRGRGSLATMQSGMYQNLASLYASEQYEAADFSYFIQQDRFDRMMREMRKARKSAKKSKKYGAIGAGIGAIVGSIIPGLGTAAGAAAGGAIGGAAS